MTRHRDQTIEPNREAENAQITRDFFDADSEKPSALDAYDAMAKVYIEQFTLELKHLEEVTLRGFDKTHNLPFIEQRAKEDVDCGAKWC